MQQEHTASRFTIIHICSAILLILILLFILFHFLRHRNTAEMHPYEGGIVSWNVLFKKGTNKEARDAAIADIKKYVADSYKDYNAKHGTDYRSSLDTFYFCPCDTLLYNYDFISVDGAGKSVTTAPAKPTGKPVSPSGDHVDIIAANIVIEEPQPDTLELPLYSEGSFGYVPNDGGGNDIVVRNVGSNPSKILAIIDSGLDTTLFTAPVQNLIWNGNASAAPIYNFLPGQSSEGFIDQTKGKHGSAVTAIIIEAMENTPVYPKLMILKALDKDNKGSVFSVSCALSYAIQKQASMVNMSLGYYGSADSVLLHYLQLSHANKPSLELFAAAGNTPGKHKSASLCMQQPSGNLLNQSRKFYPACFSQDFQNMISVTQTGDKTSPCFYQNYSNKFISLAVYNKANCCAVGVGAGAAQQSQFFEGSSFATPIASALRMGILLQNSNLNDADKQWNAIVKSQSPLDTVTVGGKYIEYTPKK